MAQHKTSATDVAKAIMFQGTGSDVGKTVLVAGLCRAAAKRGLRVRPFKPQNMSNNAAVSQDEGDMAGEMGRAQWLQALACGVPPSVHMNPVLLKPQSEVGSQIIVQGKVWGQAKGRDYQKLKPQLMDAVMDSWNKVCAGADLVLIEGAGSPAEINLRGDDIANMGFATKAKVPVALVGDIDRGGVIASLVGTHTILPDEDRALICGYLINKFRGDVSLFDDGLDSIGEFTGWPCFGVVPWLREVIDLPAEDSVALERLVAGHPSATNAVKVAVPVLSRIANFDDLDPLKSEAGVELIFVREGERIPEDAALVVIPGSKSTIADLADFKANGWDRDLQAHVARGGHVIGICGGYQMLGTKVFDPDGIEGTAREAEGLRLLAVETVMREEKTVRNTAARSVVFDQAVSGYEIHLGETTGPDIERPMVEIDGRFDGAISRDGRIMGCYLHGLFASDSFRSAMLGEIGAISDGVSHMARVENALDRLAESLELHLDIDAILRNAARVE